MSEDLEKKELSEVSESKEKTPKKTTRRSTKKAVTNESTSADAANAVEAIKQGAEAEHAEEEKPKRGRPKKLIVTTKNSERTVIKKSSTRTKKTADKIEEKTEERSEHVYAENTEVPKNGLKPENVQEAAQPSENIEIAGAAAKSIEVSSVEEKPVEKTAEIRISSEKPANTENIPEEEKAGKAEKTEDGVSHPARVSEDGTTHDPDAKVVHGILEVMQDGFGFIRSENFLPGEHDVYVNPQMIRRYGLKTGDMIQGYSKSRNPMERYGALMYIETVNGLPLFRVSRRVSFEKLTPIFPNQRLHLEVKGEKAGTAIRVLDLLAPIGKGQRGMIVSPPKAGKTTLLKQVAKAIIKNEPKMHLLILLIDERPEEVTDMKEEVEGGMVQVIYSTFDETPDNHKRVAEMTIERAKRLVEQGEDVTILLDSITRLARAYNLTVQASGRTLSGGLDPAALHPPKKFFGAARNMREGGSLTILATALVDTGSRMDDVIYEEFKGTGNMELVLNRELQERRIFPAIDILKSGTRRDDLLLSPLERQASDIIHRDIMDEDKKNSVEELLNLFDRSQDNEELCEFLVNRKPLVSMSTGKIVKVNKRKL